MPDLCRQVTALAVVATRTRRPPREAVLCFLLVGVTALAGAGCGPSFGSDKLTERERSEAASSNDNGRAEEGDAASSPSATRSAPTGEPSRALAEQYARRTYIEDPALGRRTFTVVGQGASVRTTDGSRISAFPIVIADSDGTGMAALLFRGTEFIGWASAFSAGGVGVSESGDAILATYSEYVEGDANCCPSGSKPVLYRYTSGRIVADGEPPLSFGQRGSRLRLAPEAGARAPAGEAGTSGLTGPLLTTGLPSAEIGSTLVEVEQKTGVTLDRQEFCASPTGDGSDVRFVPEGDAISMVVISGDSEIRTKSGVGIGDPLDKVFATYGDAERVPGSEDVGQGADALYRDESGNGVVFWAQPDGKISTMAAGRVDVLDGLVEFCA